MGICYCHYLIPRDNTIRPQPDRIVALIKAWLEQGYIVRPEDAAAYDRRGSNAFRSETGARFEVAKTAGQETIEQEQSAESQQIFWARLGRLLLSLLGVPPATPPYMPRLGTPFSVPPVGESLAALATPCAVIKWGTYDGTTYPLQAIPSDFSHDESVHGLQIELSDDFVNPRTDLYREARQIVGRCGCGHNLEYEMEFPIGDHGIRRLCPECGAAFRPQDQIADVIDGTTGDTTPQAGGLCHRFAIVVDFGKAVPMYVEGQNGELVEIKTDPKIGAAFMEVCRTALGIELNEFSYWY
jgi:hypothetical protein